MNGKELLETHNALQRRFLRAQNRLESSQAEYREAKKDYSQFNDAYGLRVKVLQTYPEKPGVLDWLFRGKG